MVAGLAAGAILGLLYAPKNGTETRNKISKKSEEYIEVMEEKFDEFLLRLSKKLEKFKEDIPDLQLKKKPVPKKAKKAVKTIPV